jgi:hypothetical protein
MGVVSKAILLILLLGCGGPALAQLPLSEGNVKAVGVNASFPTLRRTGNVQWTYVFNDEPGTKYQRVFFDQIVDQSDKDFSVLIKNRRGDVVERYSKQAFAKERSFWTG